MREYVDLAFIVLIRESYDGSQRYVLQLNNHLNGYSFFGGHIEKGETPLQAALRELKEETGRTELGKRWAIEVSENIPETEWRLIKSACKAVKRGNDSAFWMPFHSARAGREGKIPEKLAKVFLFELIIDSNRYPKFSQRLIFLNKAKTSIRQKSLTREVCRTFQRFELIDEAWKNLANPFIRLYVKARAKYIMEEQQQSAPYLFNIPAFELIAQQFLSEWFDRALNLSCGSSIDLRILPPAPGIARICINSNTTLKARIELRWSSSDEVFRIDFPYPESGVFVLHSDKTLDSDKPYEAGCWVWHPRLVGCPGLWLIKRQTSTVLHLALPGSKWIELPLEKKARLRQIKRWRNRIPLPAFFLLPGIYGTTDGHQQALASIEEKFEKPWISEKSRSWEQRQRLIEALDACVSMVENSNELDDQDSGYQRLYTYSAYLLDRFIEQLVRWLIRLPQDDPKATWSRFCKSAFDFERALAPISDLQKFGWLHFFDPINGVNALSQLTQLQRYDVSSKTLEHYPAVRRQNHPSFRGIICPVDSPESKQVGITLHLARGVQTDVTGCLIPALDDSKDKDLGYAASLVPFYQYNDGARSMMASKNMKQAIPIQGCATPALRTGHEATVQKLIQPLTDKGISGVCQDVSPGVDLLIAYMPWYGWNFEDGIVANQRLVDEGLLDWITEKSRSEYILPGFELAEPAPENVFQTFLLDSKYKDNLRQPGDILPETVLAYFRDPIDNQIYPVRCGGDGPGELVDIRYTQPPARLMGGTIAWKIRYNLQLQVGDKLMGRHGNKGVVSRILPPDQLPRLPNDPRLPEHLRGRAVDLVLNPHGVISRMNLGQLLETHFGLVNALGTLQLSKDGGRAFGQVDLGALRDSLLQINGKGEPLIDRYGRLFLSLPGCNSKKTMRPVTVGFQHVVRLRHIAADKAQVRPPPAENSRQLYSLVTGQPVGGRKHNGGQRIGEMEVWALAANQATVNLESILNRKSDPAAFLEINQTGKEWPSTFEAIHDHLFAVGISLENKDGKLGLGWVTAEQIKARCKPLTRSSTWASALEGRFHCPDKACGYVYPSRVSAAGKAQRSNTSLLTIEDVLRAEDYRFPAAHEDVIFQKDVEGSLERSFRVNIQPIGSATRRRSINLKCHRTKKALTVRFSLTSKKITAYRQTTKRIIKLVDVMDMPVSCPRHKNKALRSDSTTEQVRPHPVQGGLYDPSLVGGVGFGMAGDGKWSFIGLPFPVAYPQNRDTINQKFSGDIPELSRIPVLPVRYRYGRPSRVGYNIISAPDRLTTRYAQLIDMVRSKESEKKKREKIKSALGEIFKELYARLFGKFGLLRRWGLGRRVDASGRFVIVPDPKLKWNECGVPIQALISLLSDKIAASPETLNRFADDEELGRLLRAAKGFAADTDVKPTDEVRSAVRREDFWTNPPVAGRKFEQERLQFAKQIIESYLKSYPEIHVILNRQPSLHRYNMMAFRPVPLNPDDGLVLKINPLVCKGFAADFDGDEMAIHMPLSDAEHYEAERMTPTQPWNLLSVADKSPVANFDQDFILGHFLISTDEEFRARLRELLPIAQCEICPSLLSEPPPWRKDKGRKLLEHLCEYHPAQAGDIIPAWMRLAFEAVTNHGVSFSFLELEKVRRDMKERVAGILPDSHIPLSEASLKKITNALGDATNEHLKLLLEAGRNDVLLPAYGFAAMVISGARGVSQSRQLVAGRGFLAPGDIGFERNASTFFESKPLIEGMRHESSFWLAMNTRSSMTDKKLGTPKAGGLMRKLVLAGWTWCVINGDCGSKAVTRVPVTCQWTNRKAICSVCYGELDNIGLAPNGYPAGLIAAQSFGERGTQLSMQSFHSGERQLSMEEVVALLNGRDPTNDGYNWFKNASDAEGFIARLRMEKAYENIDMRHLQIIWLIIHTSEKKNLKMAWHSSRSPLSALIGPEQIQALVDAINSGASDDIDSPFVKLLLSLPPVPDIAVSQEV